MELQVQSRRELSSDSISTLCQRIRIWLLSWTSCLSLLWMRWVKQSCWAYRSNGSANLVLLATDQNSSDRINGTIISFCLPSERDWDSDFLWQFWRPIPARCLRFQYCIEKNYKPRWQWSCKLELSFPNSSHQREWTSHCLWLKRSIDLGDETHLFWNSHN